MKEERMFKITCMGKNNSKSIKYIGEEMENKL